MQAFPLVRSQWSNEHMMAGVFLVLGLFHLPQWVENPGSILDFLTILLAGLIVDVFANFLRYRRPICAVSAAVTAAMLSLLTPDAPLWGQVLGVIIALLVGKHVWGGTGKNVLNPAVTGVFVMILFLGDRSLPFTPTLLLLPAMILSLPYARFRPVAAGGFMLGMLISLFFVQELTWGSIAASGLVFWGCLVVTDPVTVTVHPVMGGVISFLAGFLGVYFGSSVLSMVFGVLGLNLLSYAMDRLGVGTRRKTYPRYKLKRSVPFVLESIRFHDLTDRECTRTVETGDWTTEDILGRIKANDVFGFGGAAFSTFEKIMTVVDADVSTKHLIINGVECDPGLIHDQWLLHSFPNEILQGIRLVCKCTNFDSVTLAVKDAASVKDFKEVQIIQIPTVYPAGAEKNLINEVLHQQLAHDAIPAECGVLVLNVQTVYAIFEAVQKNQKADTRLLTVANLFENSGQVVRATLGMKISDLVEQLDLPPGAIFCGGGIMQAHAVGDDEIVDKKVNLIAVGKYPRYKESPLCSQCGKCVLFCPVGLQVQRIVEQVDAGKLEKVGRYRAEQCLQCGLCSYVCGAGRNLAARTKTAKEYLAKAKGKVGRHVE